jgi:hypothetical protein
MRTQEQYIRLGPHNKTICWPLIDRWDELFSAYSLDKATAPAAHTFKVQGERDPCTIGPYMRTEYAHGTQTVNGYTSPKYLHGPTVYVRLHDDRAQAAYDSTIGMADGLYFQLIQWNADEAVIILNHNQIIGSRWLAVIDPRTIPAELRPEEAR